MAKKILIIIFYVNQIYADSAVLAYRCKMTNGATGYYDHPCDYMADFNVGIFRGQKIMEETIFTLKLYTKNKTAYNNIYAYKLDNKLPTILTETKSRKKSTAIQLANKRCKNAIAKIPIIHKLLKNQNDQYNNQDNKQMLTKLKRSLSRYKSIKNKYCINVAD